MKGGPDVLYHYRLGQKYCKFSSYIYIYIYGQIIPLTLLLHILISLWLLFLSFHWTSKECFNEFWWEMKGKPGPQKIAGLLTATSFFYFFLGWCYCYPTGQIHHPHLYYCHFYLREMQCNGKFPVVCLVGFFSETDRCIEICLDSWIWTFGRGSFLSPFLRALLSFPTWDWIPFRCH